MKPSMQDELEDDLAAEEENKLINEVIWPRDASKLVLCTDLDVVFNLNRNIKHGKGV